MLPANLTKLTIEDIVTLVDAGATEGLRLEFKESVIVDDELLEDVVSFANASGGDLVIGVPERRENGQRTGEHDRPTGMRIPNYDDFRQSIENKLRDGVEPRLAGVSFGDAVLDGGARVVVIRVPRSPYVHLVRKKGGYRCVSRNNVGKFPLDGAQIRDAFLRADGVAERLRQFRRERLARMVAGEFPAPVNETARLVVHVMPVAAGGAASQIDLSRAIDDLQAPYSRITERTYNFDGVIGYRQRANSARGYCQLYRDGRIEAVETALGGDDRSKGHPELNPKVDGFLAVGINRYLQLLLSLGVPAPVYVGVSVIGAKGYRLDPNSQNYMSPEAPAVFDRDLMELPEIEFQDLSINYAETARVLRPAMDVLYQSSGWDRSFNYDTSGTYLHRLLADSVQPGLQKTL